MYKSVVRKNELSIFFMIYLLHYVRNERDIAGI